MLYITNNSVKHKSFLYTQLNDQIVLFLTIQFSMSHLFALSLKVKQVLPLWARVNLGEMAMKRYSVFPKLQQYWSLSIRFFAIISRKLGVVVVVVVGSYPFAEMQSVYSTTSADWTIELLFSWSNIITYKNQRLIDC